MIEKKLSLLIVLICLITSTFPVSVTVLSNGDELPDLPSNYVEIEEKDYFVMNQSFEEGKKMEVNIEAIPKSLPLVDIYMLNEDNFTSYKNNESFVFIKNLSYERVKGDETLHLTGNLSEHGKYFFVIDNTYRGKAKPNNIPPNQYFKTAGVYYEIGFDIYKDSDDDGHYDREDAYPNDPDRWKEEDGISNISFLTTLIVGLVVSFLYKRKKIEE